MNLGSNFHMTQAKETFLEFQNEAAEMKRCIRHREILEEARPDGIDKIESEILMHCICFEFELLFELFDLMIRSFVPAYSF